MADSVQRYNYDEPTHSPSLLDEAGNPAPSGDYVKHSDYAALEERALKAEAQVERLTRPVTDGEWDEHAEWHYSGEPERLLRDQVDALIAARAKEKA